MAKSTKKTGIIKSVVKAIKSKISSKKASTKKTAVKKTPAKKVTKMSNVQRGLMYKKRQATKSKSKYVHDQKEHDLERGKRKVEVKNWSRPVPPSEIKKAAKKGVKTMIAKSGLSKEAKKLAQKKGIKVKKGK